MTASQSSVDALVRLLGGWPCQFGPVEKQHGESLLAQLRRDRVLDEGVFGMVVRYAVHRAAFDVLSAEIRDDEAEGKSEQYLSGKEQRRAYHENKLAGLERELLATPYARAKAGQSAQTSFMDELDKSQAGQDQGGGKVVTPFRPLTRKRNT